MALSYDEIRREITANRQHATLSRARLHQYRLKFHVQTELTPLIYQPANDFLAFVDNILPHDKAKMFKTLFRYPVQTNEITAVCFDKLSRVFDGQNPVFNYQFVSSEQRDDWEWYRTDKLREPIVWSTKGWEYFKTEINSVLVVDLPQEQHDTLPEPYFYWLRIEHVLTFGADNDGSLRWIIFRQDDDRVAVIDDYSYRTYHYDGANVGALLEERPHGLGYCPCRFFWEEPISLREPYVKASPLTKELEELDWYLFYAISKRHLDLYGSYPIYSGYEQACDFSNAENGDYCDGGFLKNKQGFYQFDSAGQLLRCPKCGNKRIAGVGSFVEVPVPLDGQPDLRNPVQMLSVDRSSLDYNVAEIERLKDNIITSVVGTNEEVTQRDALNEQQIRANFESQSGILQRVKRGFEGAQKFVDDTCCRLRYGDLFVSSTISYGTEFFLYDPNDLRERYKAAKESGASEGELDALQTQIIASEYRNDPTQQQRMLTLADLEPYRHLTRDEVINLYEKGVIGQTDMLLKLDFANYVRRFERENMNVLEFGENIPYTRKIDIIKGELLKYASPSINQIN